MKYSLQGVCFSLCVLLMSCGGESTPVEKDNSAEASGVKKDTVELQLDHVNDLLVDNPNDYQLIKKRAELLFDNGEFQSAFNEAKKILNKKPEDEEAQYLYGYTAFEMGEYTGSFDAYQKCVELNPENTDCLIALAEFSIFRQKNQDAMNYANAALKVDEQLYYPYFIKGNVYLTVGDTAKAVSSYRTAVELEPNFYEGYMILGTLYSTAGMDVCLEYFNSAAAARPNDPLAQYSAAMYYQENNKIPQAMKVYDEIVEENPEFKYAYYNKGFLYLTEYLAFDSAVVYFTKAIAQDSKYKEAYYNRGVAKEELGNKVAAAADFQLALTVDGSYTAAAKALSRVQEK